jgi:hypothetical protein
LNLSLASCEDDRTILSWYSQIIDDVE